MHKLTKEQRRARKKKLAGRKKTQARKSRERLRPWQAVKMKMFRVPDPLDGIPPEKRLDIVREVGRKAREDFQGRYSDAEAWFETYDPIYILSFCAMYFTSTREGIDPEASGRMEFPPHLLEILQALALTRARTLSVQPLFDRAEELKVGVRKLGDLMMLRLVAVPEHLASDEELHAYRLRTEMMSNTIAIRNWAYFAQMKRVCLDLAALVDTEFAHAYGPRASRFIQVLFGLIEQRNDFLNRHLDSMRSFLSLKDSRQMLRAYNSAFPENAAIEESDMAGIWEACGRRLRNLRAMLVSHADLALSDIYSFTVEDITRLIGDNEEAESLWNLFQSISLEFGELRDKDKEHFILDNPVTRKPFIRAGDGTLFSAIWGALPHYAIDILETMIWPHADLQSTYTAAKANYLEVEVRKTFTNAFPSAQICPRIFWTDDAGTTYENDLTVVLESFAIVVEAKSGTVTDPAKRGAPDRLFKTLKHLIEEPSEQALRFIGFLSEHKQRHVFRNSSGETFAIDSSKIKYYVPLGVTFSHLGMIGSDLKNLIDAKVVEKPIDELAPSMSFTDLEVVFDLLESEAERIHYLARRREFEAHVNYKGDELDLLGFYLDQGFNIGDAEYSKEMAINMSLKSKELDPYVIGRAEGVVVKKPRLQMTKWWSDMLEQIQRRKIEGWLETCFVLLNTTKEDQAKFEREFRQLMRSVKSGKAPKPHNWIVLASGPERRRYAIIGYPYTTGDTDLRNNIIMQALDQETAKKTRGALVIGVNVDGLHYPYSVLARRLSTDLFDTLSLSTEAIPQ